MSRKLYKYISSMWINDYLEHGQLLFRPLSYYRKLEDNRGDQREGEHRDYGIGGNGVSLQFSGMDQPLTAKYISNKINPQLVHVHCMSRVLSDELFDRFGTDTCIEVFNVDGLMDRFNATINRKRHNFYSRKVSYYDTSRPFEVGELTDPHVLITSKPNNYDIEQEHRFYYAPKEPLKVTQSVTIPGNPFNLSSPNSPANFETSLILHVLGDLRKYCRVIYKS